MNEETTTRIPEGLRREATALGLEFVDDAASAALATDIAARIPSDWARTRMLVPVRPNGEPCLLTSRPRAIEDQVQASQLAAMPLHIAVATEDIVADLLGRTYAAGASQSTFVMRRSSSGQ